jgi:hypothetical protein
MESISCSHPSLNLNLQGGSGLDNPVANKMGGWSDKPTIRDRARTDTVGNFDSQSVSMSTLSNFS